MFKAKLLNFVMRHIFHGVVEDDFLRFDKGKLIHRGVVLTDSQKKSIIGEAETILSLDLWRLLSSEMKNLAVEKAIHNSADFQGVVFGKAAFWTIDLLQKKLYNLSKLKKE